jgi:hypothetical protein
VKPADVAVGCFLILQHGWWKYFCTIVNHCQTYNMVGHITVPVAGVGYCSQQNQSIANLSRIYQPISNITAKSLFILIEDLINYSESSTQQLKIAPSSQLTLPQLTVRTWPWTEPHFQWLLSNTLPALILPPTWLLVWYLPPSPRQWLNRSTARYIYRENKI